jgi:hypothetical protein
MMEKSELDAIKEEIANAPPGTIVELPKGVAPNDVVRRRAPKKKTELDIHEVVRICEEWRKDPNKMVKWGTDELQQLVLLYRDKAWNPGNSRNKDSMQLRAMDMYQKTLLALLSVRGEVDVVCEQCGHKFKTG